MTQIERINIFTDMMTFVPHDVVKDLIDRGFFTAPASTKHHGAYEGGLFDHSFAVTEDLVSLTESNHLEWSRPNSPWIIGMFHDLCKMDSYRHPLHDALAINGERMVDYDHWEFNPDTLIKGHGDKSVILLSGYMQLTEEEILCIRYHMGAFVEKDEWRDYTNAIHKYPNVLWTHQADMLASHVRGV